MIIDKVIASNDTYISLVLFWKWLETSITFSKKPFEDTRLIKIKVHRLILAVYNFKPKIRIIGSHRKYEMDFFCFQVTWLRILDPRVLELRRLWRALDG